MFTSQRRTYNVETPGDAHSPTNTMDENMILSACSGINNFEVTIFYSSLTEGGI